MEWNEMGKKLYKKKRCCLHPYSTYSTYIYMKEMRSLGWKSYVFMALMSMKIYVQQIRRFISIDGYYTHFLIFRINLGYIENVNIANGKWQ